MQQKNNNNQNSVKKRIRQLRKLEEELELKIEKLYGDCVGHTLGNVQCAFLDTSDLYICLEGTDFPSETFLEEWGNSGLVREMRKAINQIVKEKINTTLQEDLSVKTKHVTLLKPERPKQLNVLVSFCLQ